MIKLNKKGEGSGWTLKEFLSLLMAVLIIGILIIGFVKLLSLYRNEESENAKNRMEIIKSKIDAFEIGQKDNFLLQGFEKSKAWVITGWSYDGVGRPDKCSFNSCICVCPSAQTISSLAASCQKEGFCRLFEKEKISVRTNEPASCSKLDFNDYQIFIPDSITEINLEKSKEVISLSYSNTGECGSSYSHIPIKSK